MLTIVDLLHARGLPLDDYKIHLAKYEQDSPLDAYFQGRFKEWQEQQNRKNFPCRHILGLIHLDNDRWLFAGLYKVLGVSKGVVTPYLYQTELLSGQEDLIGRVIVRYKRRFQASYITGEKYGHSLEIAEIRPSKYIIKEFPGYNSVILPHSQLQLIISQQEPSWKTALSNVKGIYLIVDTFNGKQYVGKASGENGFWGRWECYASSGHAGNIQLRELLEKAELEHVKYFQYSILEIALPNATDEFLDDRESYWKKVLLSREYGYNSN